MRCGEQGVDGERDCAPERCASDGADQRHRQELDHGELNDACPGRADRLQDRQRRALALDEALRRVGDADAADNQRQEARQRQELGETVEVAGEIGRDVEARARLPAGLGKGAVGRGDQGLDGGLAGLPAGAAHDDPGRPADQRSGLHQTGRFQRVQRD